MDKIEKDNPNLVSGNFKTGSNNIKQILDIALEEKLIDWMKLYCISDNYYIKNIIIII